MNTIDRISQIAAAGLPRREVLKTVALTLVGAAAAGWRVRASEVGPLHSTKESVLQANGKAVMLSIALPSGHKPQIHLPNRKPGVVTYKGEQITLVPQIAESTRSVELSLFQGSPDQRRFLRTVSFPISESGKMIGNAVPLNLAFLSGISIAGLAVSDDHAMYAEGQSDCSCSCCWGGGLSGCACCCDSGNPDCGSCCDPGCCPACTPPPGD